MTANVFRHEDAISAIRAGYDQWAKVYDLEDIVLILLDDLYAGRRDRILSELDHKRNALDLCCGSGRHIALLESHFNRVIGVDASSRMLELAKNKTSRMSTELVCVDVLDYKSPLKFDYINMALAMMHFSEPERLVSHIHRYLNKGGMLDIVDGTVEALNHSSGPRYYDKNGVNVIPYRKYESSEIMDLLRNTGFEIVECGDIYYDPVLSKVAPKLDRYRDIKCLYYITARKV